MERVKIMEKKKRIKVEILLKDILKTKEISLEQLATMTEISEPKLNSIENNKKEPTFNELVIISKVLGVDLEELYRVVE